MKIIITEGQLSKIINKGILSEEKPKTEVAAPAPVINVNLENNNTNQQKQSGGTNTIIKEKTVEKVVTPKEEKKKSESEDAPW